MLDPHRFLDLLRATLNHRRIDYDGSIESLGQVQASERRSHGEEFTLREHIRGLVLSLLSNQRPWRRIADHLEEIDRVFFHYDAKQIKDTDPNRFEGALRNIHCGNRNIRRQMRDLGKNVECFERIIGEHGSLDKFVTSDHAWEIARQVSMPGAPYKLKQVGPALALEYLKNVGIPAFKTDTHAKRLISSERLGFVDGYPTDKKAYDRMMQLARDACVNVIYLDNLLWLFCAEGYGNICGAQPQCEICYLRPSCTYPSAHA